MPAQCGPALLHSRSGTATWIRCRTGILARERQHHRNAGHAQLRRWRRLALRDRLPLVSELAKLTADVEPDGEPCVRISWGIVLRPRVVACVPERTSPSPG